MNSEKWAELAAILTICSLTIAFFSTAIIQGYIWIKNMHPCNIEEEKEKKKAQLLCLLNLGAFLIFIIIIAFYIFKQQKQVDSVILGSKNFSDSEIPIEVEISTEADGFIIVDELPEVIRRYRNANYSGQIENKTNSPSGKGTMKYDNGDVYEGEWVNGMREGKGCMKYNNGDMYDGEWKADMREGQGEYTWKDGRKYTGEYKADQRDGEGIYRGWRGYSQDYGWVGTYYGTSKKNKFEGDGRFEFDNGDQFVGIFSKDKIWTGMYVLKNGSRYSIVEGVRQE